MPFERTHEKMMSRVNKSARIGWNITSFSTKGDHALTMKGKIGGRDFEIHLTQNQDDVYKVEVFGVKEDKLTQMVSMVPIFTEPSVVGDKVSEVLVSMGKAVYDKIRQSRAKRGQDNPLTPGALYLTD